MSARLAQLELHPRLASLVKACEKLCVTGCCGIDAFDFSPLHIASHLSAFTGCISEDDVAVIENAIADLLYRSEAFEQDEHGFICSIDLVNQLFTRDSLASLANDIRKGLRLAPKVLAFSDALETAEE